MPIEVLFRGCLKLLAVNKVCVPASFQVQVFWLRTAVDDNTAVPLFDFFEWVESWVWVGL